MKSREEIIKGLWCCNHAGNCLACPFDIKGGTDRDQKGSTCLQNLIAAAYDAMKAQEPRVMTLEEVKDFNWDYCYLEEERLPGKEYRAVCGDYALTCITWPSVTSMRIQHGDESYGKEWRCWTSRPDNATREATPWE